MFSETALFQELILSIGIGCCSIFTSRLLSFVDSAYRGARRHRHGDSGVQFIGSSIFDIIE